jgi:aminoglycoside phosphotransferase (APT) family kinase protein
MQAQTTGETAIAAALVDYLRRVTGAPDLDYASRPEAITGGYDTAIYGFALGNAPPPFDVPLVARIYRPEQGITVARYESAVHAAVIAQGYPAPPVLATGDASEGLGGAFIVMPRIVGKRMLEQMFTLRLFQMVRLLAVTQARLHDLDASRVEADLRGVKADDWLDGSSAALIERVFGAATPESLRVAARWLDGNRPSGLPTVVCHGDYHPLNIMVAGGAVSGVIDWPMMRIAPAEFDIGASVAIMTEGPLDLPRLLVRPFGIARRFMTRRYVAIYRRHRPLDETALRYFEAFRCAIFKMLTGVDISIPPSRALVI